jgi:hypothetical protein
MKRILLILMLLAAPAFAQIGGACVDSTKCKWVPL